MSIVVTNVGRTIAQSGGNVLGPNGLVTRSAGNIGGIFGDIFGHRGRDQMYRDMGGDPNPEADITNNEQQNQIAERQRLELNQSAGSINNILHHISTPGISFEDKIDLAKSKIQNIKEQQLKRKQERDIDQQIKEKQKQIKKTETEENKYQGTDAGRNIDQQIKKELEQHKKDLEKLHDEKQKINQKREESKSIIEDFNNHLQQKKDVHLMDIKAKSKTNPKYDYEKIQDLVNKMNYSGVSGFEQDRILEDIQRNGLREFWQYPRYDQRYKLLRPPEISSEQIQHHQQAEENKENEVQNGPNILNNHDELRIDEVQHNNTNVQQEIRIQEQNINPDDNNHGGGNPYDPNNEIPQDNKNFKQQIASGLLEIAKIIYDNNTKKQDANAQLTSQDDMSNYYKLQVHNTLNMYSKQQQNIINNIFGQLNTDQVHKIINIEPEEIMSQYVNYY